MNGSIKQEADAHSVMTDMSGASSAPQQPGLGMEPMDSLLDFSDYDNVQQQYHSPSMSPAASKNSFVRSTAASTPASLLSTSQQMTGPSHQYDQYKQQTGFVPGAIANTFAVNQNTQMGAAGFGGFEMGYVPMAANDDLFDFNSAPNNASVSPSDIGLDMEASPATDAGFYFEGNSQMAVVPGQAAPVMALPSNAPAANGAPQPGNVGRLWPGMHQQAALAKAQAQQRQQQQIIQQQQQQRQGQQGKPPQQPGHQRNKSSQPSDPIVEQKITQLLNSMRQKTAMSVDGNGTPIVNLSRSRKDEDDMDEDERLLASEEGKKLSSKERRQLRNKVSARAFRSRRKEYISQLESEIAGKVTENSDLRTQNRALLDENKRLTDLTRMLLGSPSFSDFLERLSSNPALLPQNQAPAPQVEQERQAPKDVNPYAAQQQIGMAMIPEQNIDMSMLQFEAEPAFSFQPQVFAVRTPEMPTPIDASMLSGKTSNFVGPCSFDVEDEKVDMPVIAHPVSEKKMAVSAVAVAPVVVDEEFENDPIFSLYHDSPKSASPAAATAASTEAPTASLELNTAVMADVDIFGGITTEKAFARYELVDASSDVAEAHEDMALARINLIASNLKAVSSRLDMLTSRA